MHKISKAKSIVIDNNMDIGKDKIILAKKSATIDNDISIVTQCYIHVTPKGAFIIKKGTGNNLID